MKRLYKPLRQSRSIHSAAYDPPEMDVPALILAVLGGYLGKVLLDAPSQVRAHDRTIRYRDEDLLAWIKREESQLRGKFFAIDLETHSSNPTTPFRIARDKEQAKRAVSKQFEGGWRAGIREWETINDAEQAQHRIYRWLSRRPLPDLSHEAMIDALARWGEPEQPTEPDPNLLKEVAALKHHNRAA